ncbi:unnamed protein product [Phaeothamnion confervicola]
MLRSLFSFSGRMSRADYRRAHVAIWAMVFIPMALMYACGAITHSIPVKLLAFSFTAAATFPAGFCLLAINIKRAHDLGLGVLHLLIPFCFYALIFQEGEPHHNAYGPPPVA